MFWYEYLKDCWLNGTVTIEQLDKAILNGWITEQEKMMIINI